MRQLHNTEQEIASSYVGNRTVLVGLRLAFLAEPNDEDDSANNRYQSKQKIPAAFVDVVETTHCQTKTGKKKPKGNDSGNDLHNRGAS